MFGDHSDLVAKELKYIIATKNGGAHAKLKEKERSQNNNNYYYF